jgi:hypothetical protein
MLLPLIDIDHNELQRRGEGEFSIWLASLSLILTCWCFRWVDAVPSAGSPLPQLEASPPASPQLILMVLSSCGKRKVSFTFVLICTYFELIFHLVI